MLGYIVPTIGRETLAETLASIPDDCLSDVLVVCDDPLRAEWVIPLVEESGPKFHVCVNPDGPTGNPGHTILHRYAGCLNAAYICYLADDDVAMPGALEMANKIIESMPYPPAVVIANTLYGDRAIPGDEEPRYGILDATSIVIRKDILLSHPWPDTPAGTPADWAYHQQLRKSGVPMHRSKAVIARKL